MFNKRIFTTDDLQKLPKGFYILKYNDENQCITPQKTNQTMKQLLSFILIFSLWVPSYGEDIQATFQNGKIFQRNDVLLLNDTCHFHTAINNEKYTWSLLIDKNGSEPYLYQKEKNKSEFTLIIDSTFYKNKALCSQLKRITFENDSSVYYKGTVNCYKNEKLIDQFPLRINLLPAIPRITDIQLKYNSYNFDTHCFINGSATITFSIARTNHLILLQGDEIRAGGELAGCLLIPLNLNTQQKEYSYNIPIVFGDDIYIAHESINDNGSVETTKGNYVFAKDYITDPDILTDINNAYTSLEKSDTENKISIYYSITNQQLHLQGDIDLISSFNIYNANGINVKHLSNVTNIIDLYDLPRGCYIVKYIYKDRINSMKINK